MGAEQVLVVVVGLILLVLVDRCLRRGLRRRKLRQRMWEVLGD